MFVHLLWKLHGANKYVLRLYLLWQKMADSLLEFVLMGLDLYNVDSRYLLR